GQRSLEPYAAKLDDIGWNRLPASQRVWDSRRYWVRTAPHWIFQFPNDVECERELALCPSFPYLMRHTDADHVLRGEDASEVLNVISRLKSVSAFKAD